MRFEGIITSWNDDRGFGFIQPTLGGDPVFVHVKAFVRSDSRAPIRPQTDLRVSFEVELGPQGKKRAHKVEYLRSTRRATAPAREQPAEWGIASLFAIPAFLVLYLALSLLWRLPSWVAGAYAAVSLITLVVYALDKSAAQREGRRTPESTLHALALAGGWPGALIAQQWLRHKSRKAAFRSVFWGTVVINVLALIVMASPLVLG